MAADVTLPAAAAAGLLSFLSPCVLPLVPPYLTYLAGVSMEDLEIETRSEARRDVLLSSILFVLGFSTVFVALGASASWLGSLLRTELARQVTLFGFSFNPITTVAGLIIIAMGLHFLGLTRIGLAIEQHFAIERQRQFSGVMGFYLRWFNRLRYAGSGLRDLQQAKMLDHLLARVVEARMRMSRVAGTTPVLIKIAPDLTLELPILATRIPASMTCGNAKGAK